METVTMAALRRAIEGRDGAALASFYADNAELCVIDQNHPPSQPRKIQGREAIASYFADQCGRDMTHHVDPGIAEGNRLAFTQSCAYPDGKRVICTATVELADGRIARQTAVQAWDP